MSNVTDTGKPSADVIKVGNDAWTEANKAARNAATWVVVALGALATAIFGGTPLLKAFDLSWSNAEDVPQLWIAAGFGVVGLLSMITLILLVGRTLVPVLVSRRLMGTTRTIVKEDPVTWLPRPMKLVGELEEAIASAQDSLPAGRRRLAKATEARDDPKIVAAKKFLSETDARILTLNAWLSQIIRLDSFRRVRGSFLNAGVVILVILAAIGSLGFSLALVGGSDDGGDDDDAAAAPPAPQIAFLTPVPDSDLFEKLGLDGCMVGANVPVVVLATDGSESTVQTVPSATCDSIRFQVDGDIASLAFSVEIREIEVVDAEADED